MSCRGAFLGILLLILGCETFTGTQPAAGPSPSAQLWAEGQTAMAEGKKEVAIQCYKQSLAVDPSRFQNYLSLAAVQMEKGDLPGACTQLSHYVAARPDNIKARAYYAELLLRLHRTREARQEFERFDADAQEDTAAALTQLIRCHSKLTQIAREDENEYSEHLHRGIGLYFLSKARASLPDPDGELSTEGLLCKAASELSRARLYRPDEARPSWYLFEIWSELGQRQPSLCSLQTADRAAPFSYLTNTEKRNLQLACQREIAGKCNK